MSNVASLELSRELYGFSKWVGTTFMWRGANDKNNPTRFVCCDNKPYLKTDTLRPEDIPAYDLGFLIRKLPKDVELQAEYPHLIKSDVGWYAGYPGNTKGLDIFNADTPENALASLAIILIKQNILVVKEDK